MRFLLVGTLDKKPNRKNNFFIRWKSRKLMEITFSRFDGVLIKSSLLKFYGVLIDGMLNGNSKFIC